MPSVPTTTVALDGNTVAMDGHTTTINTIAMDGNTVAMDGHTTTIAMDGNTVAMDGHTTTIVMDGNTVAMDGHTTTIVMDGNTVAMDGNTMAMDGQTTATVAMDGNVNSATLETQTRPTMVGRTGTLPVVVIDDGDSAPSIAVETLDSETVQAPAGRLDERDKLSSTSRIAPAGEKEKGLSTLVIVVISLSVVVALLLGMMVGLLCRPKAGSSTSSQQQAHASPYSANTGEIGGESTRSQYTSLSISPPPSERQAQPQHSQYALGNFSP